MTENQKQMLIQMRKAGHSFSDISKASGCSLSSVKMFCSRNNISPGCKECRQCGRPLPKSMKVYCSAECRRTYWRIHKKEAYKKEYHSVCCYCHQEFVRTRNYHPKYCSHQCYIKDRYHKEDDNE